MGGTRFPLVTFSSGQSGRFFNGNARLAPGNGRAYTSPDDLDVGGNDDELVGRIKDRTGESEGAIRARLGEP